MKRDVVAGSCHVNDSGIRLLAWRIAKSSLAGDDSGFWAITDAPPDRGAFLCTRPREEPTVIEATRSRLNRAEYAAMLAPWPVRVPSDIATVSTVSRGNELSS